MSRFNTLIARSLGIGLICLTSATLPAIAKDGPAKAARSSLGGKFDANPSQGNGQDGKERSDMANANIQLIGEGEKDIDRGKGKQEGGGRGQGRPGLPENSPGADSE